MTDIAHASLDLPRHPAARVRRTGRRRPGLGRALCAILAASGLAAAGAAQSQPPTSVHVSSVETGTLWRRVAFGFRGNLNYLIYGAATVHIVDDLGQAVPGAIVTGTFTSDQFATETVSGITGSDGSLTLVSTGFFNFKMTPRQQYPSYRITFCVDGVGAGLPYDPSQNLQTCDTDATY